MKNLFIDMDGTLCEWRSNLKSIEELYEEYYFSSLRKNTNLVNAIINIYEKYPDNIFVLSCYLKDSKYAKNEKNIWLDENLNIPNKNRIFIPVGENKGFIGNKGDLLLDDYSQNLLDWEENKKVGIKFINDINGSGIKWKGERIKFSASSEVIETFLLSKLREESPLM